MNKMIIIVQSMAIEMFKLLETNGVFRAYMERFTSCCLRTYLARDIFCDQETVIFCANACVRDAQTTRAIVLRH